MIVFNNVPSLIHPSSGAYQPPGGDAVSGEPSAAGADCGRAGQCQVRPGGYWRQATALLHLEQPGAGSVRRVGVGPGSAQTTGHRPGRRWRYADEPRCAGDHRPPGSVQPAAHRVGQRPIPVDRWPAYCHRNGDRRGSYGAGGGPPARSRSDHHERIRGRVGDLADGTGPLAGGGQNRRKPRPRPPAQRPGLDQTPVHGNSEQMKTSQALKIPTIRVGEVTNQKLILHCLSSQVLIYDLYSLFNPANHLLQIFSLRFKAVDGTIPIRVT